MRKAITPIISIIVLLLIAVTLAGGSWLYMSGYMETMTKLVEVPPGAAYCLGNKATITIRNPGDKSINNSDRKAMLGLFHDDPDAVGAWRFDEEDGNATWDSSVNDNTGSIYGDTVLLMHFEGDGNATLDSTSYGNDGSIYGDTVLLMHFDEGSGNPLDSSSYANHGDITGHEPTWKSSGCKSGSCMEFEITGYVEIPNDESLNISDEITVEAWVKSIGNRTYESIVTKWDCTIACTESSWWFGIGSLNNVVFIPINESQKTGNSIGGSTIIKNDSIWHHVAATYNGIEERIYLDGNLDGNRTISFGRIHSSDTPIYIGSSGHTLGDDFNGTIDEVAIYNRSLTEEEIKAHYRAGKAKFIERNTGKSGAGIEFDGEGDNIQISNSLGLASVSFTFSHWIKTTQTAGQVYTIGNAGGGNGYRFGIGTGKIAFLIGNSTGYTESANCGTKTVNDGNWHLITGVYDRGNAFYCYVDGELNGSVSIPFYEGMSDSAPGIGAPPCCTDFNGSIDEVAIYSRALTEDEVNDLYEAGKAKFIERKLGRFGYALEFDGVDDYVEADDSNILDMSNEITISAWFKIPAILPYRQAIAGKHYLEYELGIYQSGCVHTYTSNGTTGYDEGIYACIDEEFPEDDWVPNKWYHLTWTLNGNHEIAYVNGINIGEYDKAHAGTIGGTHKLNIGRRVYGGLDFNGTIDEVVILNKSLSPQDIQAQLTPACSCSGNTCSCGDLTITKTSGEGYFHPYFSNSTIPPKGVVRMTDYSCLSDSCSYRITSPAVSVEATVQCG